MKSGLAAHCFYWMLSIAMPAWGQSSMQPDSSESGRPQNGAPPRSAAHPSAAPPAATAETSDSAETGQEGDLRERRLDRPRYGMGYEARRRGLLLDGDDAVGMRGGPFGGGRGGMRRGR